MKLIQIGLVHSEYTAQGDAPRQGRLRDVEAIIEIFEEYAAGLDDLETCTHLFVLYWLDRADRSRLIATPPGESRPHGVFSTRSPHRPNPIGIGIVDLVRRDGRRLVVRGLDALDKTPVLDIKPYVSDIDCIPGAEMGWMKNSAHMKNE